MPIHPRRPNLPIFNTEHPAVNICKEFARVDKFHLTFRHRIQFTDNNALERYILNLTNSSELFTPRWTAGEVKLPNKFGFEKGYLVAGDEVSVKYNRQYPDNVRDIEMTFTMNFHRFWHHNPAAQAALITNIRGDRRILLPRGQAGGRVF